MVQLLGVKMGGASCKSSLLNDILNTHAHHSFSADTTPSDSLVYAGQGASVLIHEATMTDDQEQMAAQKAHSTVGQAITIGTRSVFFLHSLI